MATHELTNEGELGSPPAIDPQQEEEATQGAQSYHLPQRPPHLCRRSNPDNAATTTPTTDSGESLYAWRKPFRTPSDSGTEADDEANGVLKRLPTPLVSRRIEYQFKRGDDAVNTTAERKRRAAPVGSRRSKRRMPDSPDPGELEFHITIGARLRIEVLRRICETGLVLGVAFAVMLRRSVRSVVKVCFIELSVFALLILGLYAIFPLRKCPYGSYRTKLKRIIAFPFSKDIDPAPLIYPILIPVLITLSLGPSCEALVLLNIILSLSSLPAATIPLHDSGTYSVMHWMITTVPLLISENFPFSRSPKEAMSELGLEPELLVLIFPLQKSTVSIIEYLVTSSLLPSEVQLLGTALVNVLLVSRSPQAQILKALIWLGSLCIFITCKRVLLWEATLAKIPSWKFRRASTQTTDDEHILGALDRQVCHTLNHPFSEDQASESEIQVDVDRSGSRRTSLLYNNFTKLLATEVDLDKGLFKRTGLSPQPLSPVENEPRIEASMDSLDDRTQPSRSDSQRYLSSKAGGMAPGRRTTTKGGRRKRQLPPSMRAFLSLTMEQAIIRKWAYALYVYTMVLAIILVPVRWYVGEYALGGREPFGWAIGYLFGNISSVRFTLLLWSLEVWACIPPRLHDISASCHLGWVEHLRRDSVGEASTRLFLCGYCILILVAGLSLVHRLSRVVEVDTRRKIFHGMMVAMFFPTIFVDPAFVALSCTLVLAIFLLLELFRASQVPPLARWLSYFLAPYVDGRDHRGPVVVSHIFLMLGCALPLLLSLAGTPHQGAAPWEGWDINGRDVSMVSGIVCVGMGDAAASLVGRRYGRRRWFWGGDKSIEGSASFAAAVFIGLVTARVWLVGGGWEARVDWILTIVKSAFAAVASSFMEAVLTGGNDNVVVPLVLWLLVRGLHL